MPSRRSTLMPSPVRNLQPVVSVGSKASSPVEVITLTYKLVATEYNNQLQFLSRHPPSLAMHTSIRLYRTTPLPRFTTPPAPPNNTLASRFKRRRYPSERADAFPPRLATNSPERPHTRSTAFQQAHKTTQQEHIFFNNSTTASQSTAKNEKATTHARNITKPSKTRYPRSSHLAARIFQKVRRHDDGLGTWRWHLSDGYPLLSL